MKDLEWVVTSGEFLSFFVAWSRELIFSYTAPRKYVF